MIEGCELLPPTASPEVHLTAEVPPSHRQRLARWLLVLSSVLLTVSLITALLLPSTCNLSSISNPPGGSVTCIDTSGTLHDFLSSLLLLTVLTGLAALAVSLLSAVVIRKSRRTAHP